MDIYPLYTCLQIMVTSAPSSEALNLPLLSVFLNAERHSHRPNSVRKLEETIIEIEIKVFESCL